MRFPLIQSWRGQIGPRIKHNSPARRKPNPDAFQTAAAAAPLINRRIVNAKPPLMTPYLLEESNFAGAAKRV
jgi:hypothetical protein